MNAVIIGVYFGDQEIKVCKYDREGYQFSSPISVRRESTDGKDAVLQAAKVIADHFALDNIEGIGLALPSVQVVMERNSERHGRIGGVLGPQNWQGFNARFTMHRELERLGVAAPNWEYIGVVSRTAAYALGHLETLFPRETSEISEKKKQHYAYVMIEDRIGCCIISKGTLFHGKAVPNIGHTLVIPREDSPPIPCSIHQDRPCLEAFASNKAILSRWPDADVANLQSLAPEKLGLIAHYIAQAVSNLVLICSPSKVFFGGPITHHPDFLTHLRENLKVLLANDDGRFDDPYEGLGNVNSLVANMAEVDLGVKGAAIIIADWFEIGQVSSMQQL